MAKKTRKYSKKASEEVGKALHKQKRGQQRSGTKGKAESREQAIAIGLAKARKEGAKVPDSPKKASSKRRSASVKKSSTKKISTKQSAKKSSTKKKTATKRSSSKSKKSAAKKNRTKT